MQDVQNLKDTNVNTNPNSWKATVGTVTRRYFQSKNKHLLNSWLTDVEEALKSDIEAGTIPKNSRVLLPVENGDVLVLCISGKVFTVTLYLSGGGQEALVTPQQFVKSELITIKNYGDRLRAGKMGLGFPSPDALRNRFRVLRTEEVITFDNGMSFVCTENDGKIVTMRKLCGSIMGESSVSALLATNRDFDISFGTQEVQNIYAKTKSMKTDSVCGRTGFMSNAENTVKEIEKELTNGAERRVDLGPIAVTVKKQLLSGVKWTDAEKHPLTQAQVANIYAWMQTAPVITEFRRKNTDPATEYYDALAEESLEKYYAEGKYKEVVKRIATYCIKAGDGLEIIIKSYVANRGDYTATGFSFSLNAAGAVVIKRLKFEDNDIKKRIEATKNVPADSFYKFCQEKFNADYFLIENHKKDVLMKEMPTLEE